VPNLSDPLYSVHNFVNAFNSNLIEEVKPGSTLCIDESMNSWLGRENKIPGHRKILCKQHPIGQEWKLLLNIIIQLEHFGDSWFGSPKNFSYQKKRQEWPLNYSRDIVQKLGSEYSSYISKITLVNNVCLIVASLRDQKPQCIITTALTTTDSNEVKHIVKEHNESSLVKFKRPKFFYDYSISKGTININNQ
ncbi:2521_t:CDS:2, partial [Gigaspora margarita]